MTTTHYGFGITIRDVTFENVVRRVTAALKDEGFGVLTEIDVRETLKKKLDVEFRPYVNLGACNPPLAKRALEAEPDIGLLLPCNVIVEQQGEGQVHVALADPKAMFALVDNAAVAPVAEEAEERLRRVVSALAQKESV